MLDSVYEMRKNYFEIALLVCKAQNCAIYIVDVVITDIT